MPKAAPIPCPHCGSSESLATVEHLTGYAGCTVAVDPAGGLVVSHDGYTEMDWDSSKTVGYWCKECQRALTEQELMGAAPVPPQPAARRTTLRDSLGRTEINRRNVELAADFLSRARR